MEKIDKQKKSRTDRLTQLAQTLVCCAGLDVYFAQNQRLQQVDSLPPEYAGYTDVAPEQIFVLSRLEDCSMLTHHSRS